MMVVAEILTLRHLSIHVQEQRSRHQSLQIFFWFPFSPFQSSQVTFLLNFFKALMKPAGCKEVGCKPHTLSIADVSTLLSPPFYLMHLPFLFLTSGAERSSSPWPYLSLWTPHNSMQLPTNPSLPALTDCLHSRAAERRCLAHQERVEAVVRLWRANRMSKSKLLVCHSPPVLPKWLCRLVLCTTADVYPLAVLQAMQCTWMPLDPIQQQIPSELSSVHWWRPLQYNTWNRSCILSAVEGRRMCIGCNFPKKNLEFWNDFQDQPSQHWNTMTSECPFTDIWMCACFTQGTVGMSNRISAFTTWYNQPDIMEV